MKRQTVYAIASLAAAFALSNCSPFQGAPSDFSADFGQTGDLPIATSDCKVVCARAEGVSTGFKLLGIPLSSPSETVAINNMYENARARGAKLEGESRFFVNKGLERGGRNYILFSRPTLRATGDLVQYMSHRPLEAVGAIQAQSKEKPGLVDNLLSKLPL